MRLWKSTPVFGAVLLVSLLAQTGVAQGAQVSCGQVITADTTLDSDVGPCAGDGIIIGRDNVTLDLNGYAVLGAPPPGGLLASTVGIKVDSHAQARVRNGTVAGFGTGVELFQRQGSTLERLLVRDNQNFGIRVFSFDNVVRGNLVERNGDLGVVVFGGSGNTIEGNVIRSNGGTGFHLTRGGLNTRTGGTTVRANSITANGDDGVSLGGLSSTASVLANVISSNNGNGVALGEFSFSHLVEGNRMVGNEGNGVLVVRTLGPWNGLHRILTNVALGNGLVDLVDEYPGCDANTWLGNQFGTRSQGCIS